jgi:hypothetical protein
MAEDGTVAVLPRNVRIALDNGLSILQPIAECPAGAKLTGYTVNLLPSTVNMTRAYGTMPPTRVFQGQSFNFGSYGDCIGVMEAGLCFGCAPAVGQFLEVELYFAPTLAGVRASQ